MDASSEDFLSEDDFETALAIFCCYDYGPNSSEAVKKIITVGIITNPLSINNSKKGWLLGYSQCR